MTNISNSFGQVDALDIIKNLELRSGLKQRLEAYKYYHLKFQKKFAKLALFYHDRIPQATAGSSDTCDAVIKTIFYNVFNESEVKQLKGFYKQIPNESQSLANGILRFLAIKKFCLQQHSLDTELAEITHTFSQIKFCPVKDVLDIKYFDEYLDKLAMDAGFLVKLMSDNALQKYLPGFTKEKRQQMFKAMHKASALSASQLMGTTRTLDYNVYALLGEARKNMARSLCDTNSDSMGTSRRSTHCLYYSFAYTPIFSTKCLLSSYVPRFEKFVLSDDPIPEDFSKYGNDKNYFEFPAEKDSYGDKIVICKMLYGTIAGAKIPLTAVLKASEEVHSIKFKGLFIKDDLVPFPRFLLIHCSPHHFDTIQTHVKKLSEKLLLQKIDPESSLAMKAFDRQLKEIGWWLVHSMMYQRGNAAIVEMILIALADTRGFDLIFKSCFDIEVFLSDSLDAFIEKDILDLRPFSLFRY